MGHMKNHFPTWLYLFLAFGMFWIECEMKPSRRQGSNTLVHVYAAGGAAAKWFLNWTRNIYVLIVIKGGGKHNKFEN